jgi:hypothetical protein
MVGQVYVSRIELWRVAARLAAGIEARTPISKTVAATTKISNAAILIG